MVVHQRAISVGSHTIDNCHPFEVPTGVMYHNGTISGLKSYGTVDSDTKQLAEILMNTNYTKLSDIKELLLKVVGTSYNKLVFHNYDGTIDILNEELGAWEDGIWYSSGYHRPSRPTCTTTNPLLDDDEGLTGRYFPYISVDNATDDDNVPLPDHVTSDDWLGFMTPKTKPYNNYVLVYGYLADTTHALFKHYIGKALACGVATTNDKFEVAEDETLGESIMSLDNSGDVIVGSVYLLTKTQLDKLDEYMLGEDMTRIGVDVRFENDLATTIDINLYVVR
jgi:hypothetical protein